MSKKRVIACLVVRHGHVVQSLGFARYLPVGRPEIAARFCESVESGHSSHGHSAQIAARLGISLDPVRLDSQAKYAVVGRGEADIYLRLPTRPGYVERIWDHAAGAIFVAR